MIGIGASQGIAIGKAYVLKNSEFQIGQERLKKEEVPGELDRLAAALERSRDQLIQCKSKLEVAVGKEEGRIFTTHLLLLEDPDFIHQVMQFIREGMYSATSAVQ